MSLVNSFKRWLYPTYRKYFSRAYLYEGVLKSGKGSVKCLFVDNEKGYYTAAVLQKLFMESPVLIRTFHCWIPGLKRLLASPRIAADICFANIALNYAPLFHDSATFVMQARVTQMLNISSAMETNRRYRYQRKKVAKIIEKLGLTHRVSRSKDDFDFFYFRMYKPLTEKFGDGAIVDSYEDVTREFDKGLLVLVLYDDKPVSGMLCYDNQGVFMSARSGLLDGERSYLQMGTMSAVYYFLLEYARQQGYQKVDFMRSLAFLNDGVYVHKQRWGSETGPSLGAQSWVYLYNLGRFETFARIIENIPLIVHTRNGLEGVVSIPDACEPVPEVGKRLVDEYVGTGLSGLQLLKSNGTIEYFSFK